LLPGSQIARVEGLQLKRDIATLTFREGDFYFLAPVEGRVTGAVFLGRGEIQVAPTLSHEQEFMRLQTGSPFLLERFEKMVLRFTDATFEEITQNFKIQSGSATSPALNYWQDYRKLFRKGRKYTEGNIGVAFLQRNQDLRLLLDLTRKPSEGYFSAFFDGTTWGDFLLELDPLGAGVVSPEELALVNLSDRTLGIWTACHLQTHYQDGIPRDPEHRLVDVEHYEITATAKGKRLEAVVKNRFLPRLEGLRVLPFELFARLRVSQVTDQQGRSLGFIQEDKEEDADFAVILPEGLKPDQVQQLTFEYGGDEAVMDSGGGNYTLAARSSWYPNPGFGEDRATFDLTLKVPRDLIMVATGQPAGESSEGGLAVTRWKSEVPLAVAGFNYGRFKKEVSSVPRTSYVVETYANKEIPDIFRNLQQRVEAAESGGIQTGTTLGALNTVSMMGKAKSEAQAAIALFTNQFGPLPYGRIAMTQQPFIGFGQAWPMLVYMPITAFLDGTFRHQLGLDGGRLDSFFRYVAAHEVSHQWWGHLLGWQSYRDQWLSEGFAQFSTSLFAQMAYGNDAFLKFWKELREYLFNKNKEGFRPGDAGAIALGYRLDSRKSGAVAQEVMYGKGAYVVHMLRMLMWDPQSGDTRFLTMLREFVQTYTHRNVSTEDFKRMVEKHLIPALDLRGNGRMDWFFNQWVKGTRIPEYRLTYRLEDAPGGQTKVVGTIAQDKVDPSFMMRVPVYANLNGRVGRLLTAVVEGNSSTREFQILLPQKPNRLMLCAYEDVLCFTNDR
jgi:hypothetical protein